MKNNVNRPANDYKSATSDNWSVNETQSFTSYNNSKTPNMSDINGSDLVNETVNNVSPFASTKEQTQTLRDNVETALKNYFDHLDGQPVVDLYDMVLSEVEAPLLETVMKYTRDNQTKASVALGLNRGTLRKKLKQYGML